jgi:hypothetical protein
LLYLEENERGVMLDDKERKIKELRTHEAMKKKFMGPGGKFGVIVKNLGDKILAHNNSAFLDVRYMEDPDSMEDDSPYEYDFMDAEKIYNGSEDDSVGFYGWHFDGLTRGMHIEIRYLEHDKELTVYYKGFLVYREVSGDLRSFSPKDEWEEKIDQLFRSASAVKSNRDKNRDAEDKDGRKKDWLHRVNELRLRWGL